MAALQQKLKQAIAQAQRDALLSELLSDGDLTIGELAKVKGVLGDTIRRLTINELRAGGGSKGRGRPSSSSPKPTSAGEVDTRTGAGRRAFQDALLAAVQESDGPISAPELRQKLGGTPDQARRALNRLIETGKIGYTGKARGTRYNAKR